VPSLAEIELDARTVLAPFGDPACRATWPARSAALRPRASDYDRIFIGRVVAGVRDHFTRLWDRAPVLRPKSGQTELEVSVAWSHEITTAAQWPFGYRRLGEYLVAEIAWARARFCRVNVSRGLVFDGLVRIDDRWIWLPIPWGVTPLAAAVANWVD
jgi:hypothetical protein